jgi:hypothetical protein
MCYLLSAHPTPRTGDYADLNVGCHPGVERGHGHGEPTAHPHRREFAGFDHPPDGTGGITAQLLGGIVETEQKLFGHAAFPKVRHFQIP